MKTHAVPRECRPWWSATAGAVIAAAACALQPTVLHAGQAAERFDVNIKVSAASTSCTGSNSLAGAGASASVTCGTSGTGGGQTGSQQVARGDAYRVLTRDEVTASVDSIGGAIATTAVRVVNLPGRQYIEMTVGW